MASPALAATAPSSREVWYMRSCSAAWAEPKSLMPAGMDASASKPSTNSDRIRIARQESSASSAWAPRPSNDRSPVRPLWLAVVSRPRRCRSALARRGVVCGASVVVAAAPLVDTARAQTRRSLREPLAGSTARTPASPGCTTPERAAPRSIRSPVSSRRRAGVRRAGGDAAWCARRHRGRRRRRGRRLPGPGSARSPWRWRR